MLTKLFGSKARVSILKLFFLNPKEKFYVRQIARRLGLQVNAAKRELDNLEKLGLLKSQLETVNPNESKPDVDTEPDNGKKSGKAPIKILAGITQARTAPSQIRKYYQINLDFVLLDELKNLIIHAQVLYEKDFTEKIKKAGLIKLLIFTGVFAGNGNSPVDILIVGKVNKGKLNLLIGEMEKELEKELNFTVMDYNEFKYRRDITDVFLYNILEGKKMVIIDETGQM
ncbi:MAG: helix-turn-helix domain-containing protein [Patescibacteria group bacterium]|jgi:DNA-binding Lrp family transcriptional regulator